LAGDRDKVADAMLKLAKISKTDVVYDLGCGDGKIVHAAAKKFGARGVGIDINPDLVKVANENAVKGGWPTRRRSSSATSSIRK
jgi:methylase of polypeptide subunit release factors